MSRWSTLFTDVRVWILLFFMVRMFGIADPPLEVAHNYRQSAVNMVARNFLEVDNNILYPRLDVAGERSGVTGMEFPFFNYLIYWCYSVFGFSHWYGRLLNLVVSSIGTWFFYKVIREWVSDRVAFYATLVFLASLWFTYARKIMPDTFSVSLCMMGLYYGLRYIRQGGWTALVAYLLFATLGILSKIPAMVVLSPLALVLFGAYKASRKAALIAASSVPLVLAGGWYFYWFDHLVSLEGFQFYFMGEPFPKGLFDHFEDPESTLDNFYFDALKFTGFGSFLLGIYFMARKSGVAVWGSFAIGTLAFLTFIVKAGHGFQMHEYYTLPYVPLMAFAAGYGLSELPGARLRNVFLATVMIEGIANQQHDFFYKSREAWKPELEALVDEYVPGDARIAVNGGANPQLMYFAHRKGWSMESEQLREPETLKMLARKGAACLVWEKRRGALPPGEVLYEDEQVALLKPDL